MSIIEFFKNLFPSYRMGKSLLKEIECNNNYNKIILKEVDNLSCQIKELDEKNEFLFWMLKKYENETDEEVKRRVFIDMPKATGDLRKIQMAENYILQRVKNICDTNGIHFWLGYGTLIGAIRHHGFIPWDDDIDICMLKKDCDKLFLIIKNDDELDIKKYYQHNAAYITKVKFRGDDSVFIDIFTFDFAECLSEEDANIKFEETQKTAMKCQSYNAELLDEMGCDRNNIIKPFSCEEIESLVEENYNREAKKMVYYGHGNYIGKSLYMSTDFRTTEKFCPVEWYLPLKNNSIEFEGKSYDAPANSDIVLKKIYGDIWSLPSSITNIHAGEFSGYEKVLKMLNV